MVGIGKFTFDTDKEMDDCAGCGSRTSNKVFGSQSDIKLPVCPSCWLEIEQLTGRMPRMREEQEIRDKIEELKRKAWKDEKEERKLKLVKKDDGRKHLNPDRTVWFAGWGCLDMYNPGRFNHMWRVLEWALQSSEKDAPLPEGDSGEEANIVTLKCNHCGDEIEYNKNYQGVACPKCWKGTMEAI